MKPDKKQPEDMSLFLRDPNAYYDLKAEERRKRQQQEDADFKEVAETLRFQVFELHSFPDNLEAILELTGIPVPRLEAIEDRIAEFWRQVCRTEISSERFPLTLRVSSMKKSSSLVSEGDR